MPRQGQLNAPPASPLPSGTSPFGSRSDRRYVGVLHLTDLLDLAQSKKACKSEWSTNAWRERVVDAGLVALCERALVSYVDKYIRVAGRKLSGLKVLLMLEKERMKA